MPNACPECGHVNRDGVEWCDGCGTQLEQAAPPGTPGPAAGEWRLVPKDHGLLLEDRAIPLNGSPLLLGRFDASTGPVDIDISQLPGAETTSRRHALLQYVGNGWTVGDVESANGVFIRRAGEERFSSRIIDPTAVASGDEIGLGMVVFLLQGPAAAGANGQLSGATADSPAR
jgi:hypothetical protein